MPFPRVIIFLTLLVTIANPGDIYAQALDGGLSALTVTENANGGIEYSLSLQILALMTALTLLPSIILGMTSFTRIIIVLSILRQAMGTQQTPPNQVLVSVALFLSFYIMMPTFTNLYENVITPYTNGSLPAEQAMESGASIVKQFLVQNTRENDLLAFAEMGAGETQFQSPADVPFATLLPAFITSELKTAFQIGFMLFLPFLVIDMVIASILMSLGMMMLSPILVSLPFKLLLFVLVDGWTMTVGTLVATYKLV